MFHHHHHLLIAAIVTIVAVSAIIVASDHSHPKPVTWPPFVSQGNGPVVFTVGDVKGKGK
jgi:hypothetical protein